MRVEKLFSVHECTRIDPHLHKHKHSEPRPCLFSRSAPPFGLSKQRLHPSVFKLPEKNLCWWDKRVLMHEFPGANTTFSNLHLKERVVQVKYQHRITKVKLLNQIKKYILVNGFLHGWKTAQLSVCQNQKILRTSSVIRAVEHYFRVFNLKNILTI